MNLGVALERLPLKLGPEIVILGHEVVGNSGPRDGPGSDERSIIEVVARFQIEWSSKVIYWHPICGALRFSHLEWVSLLEDRGSYGFLPINSNRLRGNEWLADFIIIF